MKRMSLITLFFAFIFATIPLHTMKLEIPHKDHKKTRKGKEKERDIEVASKSTSTSSNEGIDTEESSPTTTKTDKEIAAMLSERLGKRLDRKFSQHPEIASDVGKIALQHYNNNIDTYGVLGMIPETPRDKSEYKKQLNKLEAAALQEAIINMKEASKRDTIRLEREGEENIWKHRIEFSTLALNAALGFLTLGISAATLISFWVSGNCSS